VRGVARGLVVVAASLLALCVPAVAHSAPAVARAHGAPAMPPSRAFACGPQGASAATAACRAAIAMSGNFADWDNIRVANVGGRDRTVIPDGRLCSGGLDQYRGLDLARTDWPATPLTPGASYSFSYRASIAHKGTFRLYLSTSSYDASRPLRWADLETEPFLTATNPTMRGDAYIMDGRVPTGRTGRQMIFTIWQNTSTPDTYYSCSDVVFPAAGAAIPTTNPVTTGAVAATSSQAAPTVPADATTEGTELTSAVSQPSRMSRGVMTAVVVGVIVLIGTVVLVTRRRAPSRHRPR
jgi:predicted carbohydrate-binding protein with CBM5 and CBM33 domain